MNRTEREMKAGAANSARLGAIVPKRPRAEPWDHVMQSVFRPADGAGSQDRKPETIGKGRDLFSRVR